MELSSSVDTASTSDKYLTLILRIKVQQNLSAEEAWLESHSSVKTGFLRCREKTFNLSARHVTVKNCKLGGDADTAVGPEGGVRGDHPSVLDDISDRILGKVVFHAFVLLADHVRVALKHDYRNILITGRSLLDYEHITCLVGLAFQIAFSRKILKVCYNMFFVT